MAMVVVMRLESPASVYQALAEYSQATLTFISVNRGDLREKFLTVLL